jgi:hypothetical protein
MRYIVTKRIYVEAQDALEARLNAADADKAIDWNDADTTVQRVCRDCYKPIEFASLCDACAPKPRERTVLGITKEQQQALKRVFERGNDLSYLSFRRTAKGGPDCVMLPWCGMWLGIEPDGYTHS